MKKQKNTILTLAMLGLCILFILPSCKKDAVTEDLGNGAIKISLTDLPANYLEVNIDIKQVRIHISDDTTNNAGWIDLPTHAGIYNLLDLQNGIDTTLVDSTIVPGGKVSQIRLVLGPACTIMTSDSVLHALKVPSGEQSGLKINVHKTITGGQTFNVLLDFDAEKSVIDNGNGDYSLKPVIKIK